MGTMILLLAAPPLIAVLVLYIVDDLLVQKIRSRLLVGLLEVLIAFLILFAGIYLAASALV